MGMRIPANGPDGKPITPDQAIAAMLRELRAKSKGVYLGAQDQAVEALLGPYEEIISRLLKEVDAAARKGGGTPPAANRQERRRAARQQAKKAANNSNKNSGG